ncbi:MAG: low molecular weight phosphotyrosine protein phosphatase [Nitrococcus sp.]|nr:low molecular weight phosphotyrosine protein phosphatase [Nitrococcus sp.]
MIRVLFVCMGNICRSPTAEGIFRHLVKTEELAHLIETDSAGTHDFHVGRPPDPRAMKAAAGRGIDISGLRARAVDELDFTAFDWIIAMDSSNLAWLQAKAPAECRDRIYAFMDFASALMESEVPDPYFGGPNGFDYVLDLVDEAARGLLQAIRDQHGIYQNAYK